MIIFNRKVTIDFSIDYETYYGKSSTFRGIIWVEINILVLRILAG